MDPCPFAVRWKQQRGSDAQVSLLLIDKGHLHTFDDLRLESSTLDATVEDYIKKETCAGRHASKIHLDLRLHMVLQFHEQGIKPNFRDKRMFPSLNQVRSVIQSYRNRNMRLAVDDVEDVQCLAREQPTFVRMIQEYKEADDRVAQHLIVHVGGAVEEQNYQTFGKSSLILLDATHKFNDVGYRTYTMMAVDMKTNRPRICGHMITSDLSHEALTLWLKHVCAAGPPSEVLIDCCPTETLAIDLAFEGHGVHIAYCFFHAMKAILGNVTGLSREKKTIIKAFVRRLFLTRDEKEFKVVLAKIEEIFKEWPAVLKYWTEYWIPKMDKWANIHRRYPQVRTTNFLESFHQFMKFSGVGAHRQLVRRVGDAIRILLACDISKHLDLCLALAQRIHGNASAKVQLQSAHLRADKLLVEMERCTHDAFEKCACSAKVVCEDSNGGLYAVHSGDDSYEINMERITCTCLAFENKPYIPCKHILVVAKLLATAAERRKVKMWHIPGGTVCSCSDDANSQYLKKIDSEYDFRPCKDKEDTLMAQILEFAIMHFRCHPRPAVVLNLADFGYEKDKAASAPVEPDCQQEPATGTTEPTQSLPEEDRGWGGDELEETSPAEDAIGASSEQQSHNAVERGIIEKKRTEAEVLIHGLLDFVRHADTARALEVVINCARDVFDIIPTQQQPLDRRSSRLYAAHSSAGGVPSNTTRKSHRQRSNNTSTDDDEPDAPEPPTKKLTRNREGGFLSVLSQGGPKSLESSAIERSISQGRITETTGTELVQLLKAKAPPTKRTARQRRAGEIAASQREASATTMCQQIPPMPLAEKAATFPVSAISAVMPHTIVEPHMANAAPGLPCAYGPPPQMQMFSPMFAIPSYGYGYYQQMWR
jgi:hypothetical protein